MRNYPYSKVLTPRHIVYSEAAELKLTDLAEGKILRVGDVLSYRRNFSQLDITIEKDVIVRGAIVTATLVFLICCSDRHNKPKDLCNHGIRSTRH